MDNKRRAQKRERAFAPEIGGKAHPGSGSVWYKKGDASSELYNILCEDKFTDKSVYSVKYDILSKLEQQARKIGKTPIFRFGYDKLDRNFVLTNGANYNKYTGSYPVLSTDNKSIALNCQDLVDMRLDTTDIILAEVTFNLYNKRYILLYWDDFIENIQEFCAQ